MSAQVISLPSSGGADLRQQLDAVLASLNIKLVEKGLCSLQNYDLHGRRVLFVGAKRDSPYCIVGVNMEGRLLGNVPLRELPMTLSCIRNAGKSVVPILHCGAFEAIRIQYFMEDLAIVINAGRLLERIRSIR